MKGFEYSREESKNMRINEKYERELNLRDLLFHILYHWRSILAVALGAAVLLGGLQYIHIQRSGSGEPDKASVKAQEEYNIQKKVLEDNMVRWAQGRDTNKEYLDNSVYMKLDPLQVATSIKRYMIQLDPRESEKLSTEEKEALVNNALQIYGFVLDQNLDTKELEEVFGTPDIAYVKELARVESAEDGNTLSITVLGATPEISEKGCDYLAEKISQLVPEIQTLVPHTLKLISEVNYVTADKNVLAAQQATIEAYNEYNTKYEYTLKDYHALEEPVVVLKKDRAEDRAILGFGCGLVIMLIATAGYYLFNNRLYGARELSRKYSIPVFGEMNQSRAWRKGKGIDKLIEKWEFRYNQRTDESVYQNVSELLAGETEAKNIVLASTLKEKEVKTVQENLKNRLEDKEIMLVADFANNQDAISTVKKADVILLLEKKYKTRNNDVEQMAELLQAGGANVIGTIVL